MSMNGPWVDISRPIDATTPVYEGDVVPRMQRATLLNKDDPDSYNSSVLELGTHTATHIDPPIHVCHSGETVDQIDLDILCGEALVLDLRGVRSVRAEHLARHQADLSAAKRVLLRTDGSDEWQQGFRRDYAHLTLEAARWLRSHTPVQLLGIDTWSIEVWDSPGFPVHKALLCQRPPIIVAEGLSLRDISQGWYELVLLPLFLRGADGGPARAILAPKRASG